MTKKLLPPLEDQRFLPLMDWWVAALIGGIILILIVAIPLILWQPIATATKVLPALALIVMALYLIDISFFSSYTLTEEGLKVSSQLRHFLFPYRLMREIRPGNLGGLFSTPGKKRFALSANCLVIRISHGPWKRITLSPKQREAFIDQLLRRIEDERSQRATVSKPAHA